MATISFSLPILSIPLYYTLAILPHGIAILRANKADLQRHDNRNPKGSTHIENIRKRLTIKEFAAFERAESCHRNHLENMPLYIATIFAAILAEAREGENELGLINFVVGWMLIRTVYTLNYLYTESNLWSYLRSLLYFWGTGWSFILLWRSAVVLGN